MKSKLKSITQAIACIGLIVIICYIGIELMSLLLWFVAKSIAKFFVPTILAIIIVYIFFSDEIK